MFLQTSDLDAAADRGSPSLLSLGWHAVAEMSSQSLTASQAHLAAWCLKGLEMLRDSPCSLPVWESSP